jgi:hypothetical protein
LVPDVPKSAAESVTAPPARIEPPLERVVVIEGLSGFTVRVSPDAPQIGGHDVGLLRESPR